MMISHKIPRLSLLVLTAAALTGCDKKEAPVPVVKSAVVPLVADAARSPAFDATVAHLDVGGPVFAFVDTDGDPKRVADALLKLYAMGAAQDRTVPKPPETLDPFLADLGLANIHATGFSSRRDGAAFVNRSFLYTPGGPAGLATIFGSKNIAFVSPTLAPADTIFVAEGRFDGEKLLAVARAVAGHIGDGKNASAMLEKFLTGPLPNSPCSAGQLLKALSGSSFIGIQVSTTERIPAGKATVPAIDCAIALDGREELFSQISGLIESGNVKSARAVSDEPDFSLLITLSAALPGPYSRYAPVIALQKSTKRLWLATNRATLDAWTKPAGEKLAGAPEFQKLAAGLAGSGTGFAYVSPAAGQPLRDIFNAVMTNAWTDAPEASRAQLKMSLDFYGDIVSGLFPKNGAGLYSVSFVTPDGLAGESRSPLSTKPNAYVWACNGGIVPVAIIGSTAALAIPAFKKVRNNAIEKTLMNDARQVSSAANQYFAENAVTSCRLGDLIGPGKFLSSLSSGNRIGVTNPVFAELPDPNSPGGKALTLDAGKRFVVGNANYDRTLSSNPQLSAGYGAKDVLTFDVDTGRVVAPVGGR